MFWSPKSCSDSRQNSFCHFSSRDAANQTNPAETTTVSEQQQALIDLLGEKPSCAVLGCVLQAACLSFTLSQLGNNLMYANVSERMTSTFELCCSCCCSWCMEPITRTNVEGKPTE